jgi:hypothetical protein
MFEVTLKAGIPGAGFRFATVTFIGWSAFSISH